MKQTRQDERGFTLLEILAVLLLITFILTMLVPNIFNRLQKGQVDAAKAQIGILKSALNAYYLDNSSFPSTEQGLKALLEKPTIPPVSDNWNGPYLDTKMPRDPWDHELKYVAPGPHNPQTYDIYSLGKDNAEGGTGADADIGNW